MSSDKQQPLYARTWAVLYAAVFLNSAAAPSLQCVDLKVQNRPDTSAPPEQNSSIVAFIVDLIGTPELDKAGRMFGILRYGFPRVQKK